MEIINAYFGDLLFIKVEKKENFTIYAAAITSSYGDGKKQYALAFVLSHLAILDKGYLRDLHWQNLQTRTLTNGYKLPSQRWIIARHLPTPMFDIIERNEAKSKYKCESEPLEMILLHDPKKKTPYQYHNRMNLMAALVTFKCVISLLEDPKSVSQYSRNGVQQYSNVSAGIPINSLAVRMPVYSTPVSPGSHSGGYVFNDSLGGNTDPTRGSANYSKLDLEINVEHAEADNDDDIEFI
jgi:hypothetical protein